MRSALTVNPRDGDDRTALGFAVATLAIESGFMVHCRTSCGLRGRPFGQPPLRPFFRDAAAFFSDVTFPRATAAQCAHDIAVPQSGQGAGSVMVHDWGRDAHAAPGDVLITW